ncbi:hypothetical protein NG800_003725 [Epilithonimonas ginsengisoli]|uniref:Uncharacterized protein n=1 Tax=Epilithonimonas ginsengisoli TaxID=1245592 RepID=A0ABU4JEB0_9FLAO|nr:MULTISPECIES: hypothetical protein [Chryseobacterium group]MBV6879296.1 hypothetical protein [Epilithonimonas sp. FP105]MDW8548007.1 hypothetical protein [Epilithonimonas ginsengisoli]OAH73074.1 hypothetical protein AXA65_08360 [Chryseobacterium sp. FP211-J200]
MDYKLIEKLQTLLPLGYLYLIILGILRDGVFFYMLGINFIKFSSITDVLMSPIADLTRYPILLIAVVAINYALFLYNRFHVRSSHKNWVRSSIVYKKFWIKNGNATEQDFKNHIKNQFLNSLLVMIASFFLGGGIGFGITARDRIENNNMTFNHKITYDPGKSAEAYMIDSNSVYYFFVEKGQKNISISSTGSIEKVELINNRMLR